MYWYEIHIDFMRLLLLVFERLGIKTTRLQLETIMSFFFVFNCGFMYHIDTDEHQNIIYKQDAYTTQRLTSSTECNNLPIYMNIIDLDSSYYLRHIKENGSIIKKSKKNIIILCKKHNDNPNSRIFENNDDDDDDDNEDNFIITESRRINILF